MRFGLDEQQRAFQGVVTEYLEADCSLARALAPHESGAPDYGIWQGLMELGVGGLIVPERYGGLGLNLLDLAVIAEPLGRFAAPGPFLEHAMATVAIITGGSDAQKAAWLPALASGDKRATIALSEQKGAWTADSWEVAACGAVSGVKRNVLHAEDADLIVVGVQGGRLALVEGRAAGITIEPVSSTDAGKRLANVTFAASPCEMMAPVGQRVVDAGLILLAADAFGGSSHCVEMAVGYSKEREQFGQPIGTFQAVKHQLADMALAVEPSVGLYWHAAHAFDADPGASSEAAALAKSHICEVYPRIARKMIEAHGGIGYTWEFGAHVWLKRALFDQAYLGMPQAHRQRVAAMAGW